MRYKGAASRGLIGATRRTIKAGGARGQTARAIIPHTVERENSEKEFATQIPF